MKAEEIERQFAAGERIIARRSESRELFVVRSGTVVVDLDDGSEPRPLGPGSIFGELSALVGAPSPYAAEAEGEVTVLALDLSLVTRLTLECPEFALRLACHLAEELATARRDRAGMTGRDALLAEGFERLVPVLFRRGSGDDAPFPVEGRLADLAEEAGLSLLEAYHCLQRLLERRLLHLVDDELSIADPDQLRDVAPPAS